MTEEVRPEWKIVDEFIASLAKTKLHIKRGIFVFGDANECKSVILSKVSE